MSLHAKNADMYPIEYKGAYGTVRQNLPSGSEPTLSFPVPTSDISTQTSSIVSAPALPRSSGITGFEMRYNQNSRMAGSVPVWNFADSNADTATGTIDPSSNGTAVTNPPDGDFSFSDVIDMINPLQHIPLLNQAYRAITGDVIKPIAEVIGGALFGGPVGAATGAASAAVENTSVGKDIKNAFSGIFSSEPSDSHGYSDTTIAITNLRSPERYND